MRSFEERKAEILRRSKERIKIRKQRQKVICTVAASFALFTGLSMFALTGWWNPVTGEMTEENALESGIDQVMDEAIMHSPVSADVVTVEVMSGKSSIHYAQSDKVQAIANIVDGIVEAANVTVQHSSAAQTPKDGQEDSSEDYQIVLTDIQGGTRAYIWKKTVLIDCANQQIYLLTNWERAALKDVLDSLYE